MHIVQAMLADLDAIKDYSQSVVDTVNCTTTVLDGDEVFEGGWTSLLKFSTIVIIGSSDQPGTLSYQFSNDGETVLRTVQLSNGQDGAFGIHMLGYVAPYGRIRLVNGSVRRGPCPSTSS